jgi:type VI secretion system secreted protein Hcp
VTLALYLKIDGIKGESIDVTHKDEIDIDTFSWGVTHSGALGVGGGAATAIPGFADFTFVARQSVASPALFLACAQGKQIAEAVLAARRVGNVGLDYYTITFKDIVLTGFHEVGTEGTDDISESVSFAYGTVKVEYHRQDATGALGAAVTAGWNVKTNKKLLSAI